MATAAGNAERGGQLFVLKTAVAGADKQYKGNDEVDNAHRSPTTIELSRSLNSVYQQYDANDGKE